MGHRPPNMIDKINYVVEFVTSTCEAPWVVYVETLKPAIQSLFLGIVLTSMTDIIRAFTRPKGLRSGRHGRKKGKGGKRGIPDTAELIGKTVGDTIEMSGRVVSNGVKTLWIIDTIAQRAFFYWFVAELLTDASYEWVSAIMADPRTRCDGGARMLRQNGEAIVAVFGPPIVYHIPKLEYQSGGIDSSTVAVSLPEGIFDVMLCCTVHWAAIFPTDICSGRIILREHNRWIDAEESSILFYQGSQDLIIHQVVKGRTTLSWVIDTPIRAGVIFSGGTISIVSRQ